MISPSKYICQSFIKVVENIFWFCSSFSFFFPKNSEAQVIWQTLSSRTPHGTGDILKGEEDGGLRGGTSPFTESSVIYWEPIMCLALCKALGVEPWGGQSPHPHGTYILVQVMDRKQTHNRISDQCQKEHGEKRRYRLIVQQGRAKSDYTLDLFLLL